MPELCRFLGIVIFMNLTNITHRIFMQNMATLRLSLR